MKNESDDTITAPSDNGVNNNHKQQQQQQQRVNSYFRAEINKEKRLKQIENYLNFKMTSSNQSSQDAGEENDQHVDAEADEDVDQQEKQFLNYLLKLNYPLMDNDENLIEMAIRFALTYLEEYDYELKLVGVKLLTHLLDNLTEAKLKSNMRSELIYDTLTRYLNDKDSLEFLDKCTELACKLVNLMESKYQINEHYFKKHSLLVDSLLSNCYMSTHNLVKCVYLKNLKYLLAQMGLFSCRHLDKYLTVLFDCIELAKLNIDFSFSKEKFHLMLASLDLLKSLAHTCFYRIYSHSKRIVNFLLKLLYFYSLSMSLDSTSLKDYATLHTTVSSSLCSSSVSTSPPLSSSSDSSVNCMELLNGAELSNLNDAKLFICLKSIELIELLFKNERIRISLYDEFKLVKADVNLNKSFLKLIENI